MNLLDATTHVVDAAKSSVAGERPPLSTAIKRLEKRIQLLRIRAAKLRRRNRHKAFWHGMRSLNGGVVANTKRLVVQCPQCSALLDFGDFVRLAEITGRGHIRKLECPTCDANLAAKMDYTLDDPPDLWVSVMR